jgi:hypothetical protein
MDGPSGSYLCRVGYRAACDTVLRGIPCRVGYRAAQDNVPSGMLRRTGYHAFVCFRLVCFRSGRLLVDILGDARVYFGRSEAVDAVIMAARSSGWVTLSSVTTIISTLTTIIMTLTTIIMTLTTIIMTLTTIIMTLTTIKP